MNRTVHEISRYEDARAALANPDLVPEMPEALPAAEGKEGAFMAWLRASVPRFSSGGAHARRRALVEAELARLDVARLREAAARWPESEDAAPYVVSTLAEALGYREPHAVAEAVGVVARVYFGGEAQEADEAVARLVELLCPPEERQGEGGGRPLPDDLEQSLPDGGLGQPLPDGLGQSLPDGLRRSFPDGGLGRSLPDGLGQPLPDGLRRSFPDGGLRQTLPDGPGQPLPDGLQQSDCAELAAARICLLVQARDATAALVRHADAAPVGRADTVPAAPVDHADTVPAHPDDTAPAADTADPHPIETLLHETLRNDPPVRVLRRVAARDTRVAGTDIAAGDLVLLDTTAAAPTDVDAPLAFGAPPRVCPGRDHALALAAGALAHRQPSATPFARLHRKAAPLLLLPNAWDCASAAALADAGFEAVGTTSLGVAAAAGLPDGEGVTADDTLALARRLGRSRSRLLFTVDMEGGFSDDPEEVADFARQLAAAGAAGINLEDGCADGTLTPAATHAAKIAAVKAAVPDLFVNARADTYWLGQDPDGEATEERLAAYQQAGADGLFVPGLAEPDRIRALAARFELPLNILYSPTGPTLDELAALGVRRVSLGSLLYRRALGEAVATARAVRAGRQPTGDTLSYDEVQAL